MTQPLDTIITVTDADIARMFAGYPGQIDEVFVMTIHHAAEALPVTDADVMTPYDVGWANAELGQPCEPLHHYAKLLDIEQFIIGWKDATRAIECAAEYEDYFAETEFNQRGC